MAITEPTIILASQSAYRRELLARLVPNFAVQAANTDESRSAGEQPAALAARLAAAKAAVVAEEHRNALVIGSDQVASLGDRVLGKPGSHANAALQLNACSGRSVVFYTAVTVTCRDRNFAENYTDITTVHFRDLSRAEIDAYLRLDEPWDCAGSFKSEAHGSLLFTAIENQDPTGLIGLPIIWLGNCLRRAGIELLPASDDAT